MPETNDSNDGASQDLVDGLEWSPIIQAGARGYIEATHGPGTWEALRPDQRHKVSELVLPILRAAVPVALAQVQQVPSVPDDLSSLFDEKTE